MKLNWALLLTCICTVVLVGTGCAPAIVVNSDYDKEVDFKQYHSFAFSEMDPEYDPLHPMFDNELNHKRVKAAIQRQMMLSERFELNERDPDLLVDYHIVIEDKTTVDKYHTLESEHWKPYEVEVFDYIEGTLVVHLVDSKNDQLVWQGSAVSVLRTNAQKPEERINKAVERIFETYPFLQ